MSRFCFYDIIYEPDQQFIYPDFDGNDAVGKISKVIFSPFGGQFVVTDSNGGLGARRVMDMAMQDDEVAADNNYTLDYDNAVKVELISK